MKLFLEYVFAPNKVWYLLQNRLSFLFAHHTSIDLKTEGGWGGGMVMTRNLTKQVEYKVKQMQTSNTFD